MRPEAHVRVYLDTSVISAYFDPREPERRTETIEFWEALAGHEPTISPVVLREIARDRNATRRDQMLAHVRGLAVAAWTEPMQALAEHYIAAGVFTEAMRRDAQHAAACTVAGIPVLVSWNFRHLVNRSRRIRVNLVNVQRAYNQVEILAPPEWP
jgi:predicted nucleic acid-binding protein